MPHLRDSWAELDADILALGNSDRAWENWLARVESESGRDIPNLDSAYIAHRNGAGWGGGVMNLKNQPPVFVPLEFRKEMEALSKAALMDMVWDYAAQIGIADQFAETGIAKVGRCPEADAATIAEFRKRREIIESHRAQAKKAGG